MAYTGRDVAGRPLADTDEAALLHATRQGDRAAFEELWLRNVVATRAYAARRLPATAVDEVVSDAFLASWEALLHGHGPDDRLLPYLITAVRSAAARRARQLSHELPVEQVEDSVGLDPVGGDGAFVTDQQEAVRRAFYALKPRDRRALLWAEVDGLAPAEVAQRLAVTVNTAYQVVFRAKARLRELYVRFTDDTQLLPKTVRRTGPAGVGGRPRGPWPSHVGAVVLAALAGIGLDAALTTGRAQAFGTVWEIAEPTGMPVLPAAVTASGATAAATKAGVAGFASTKVAMVTTGVVAALVAAGMFALVTSPTLAPADMPPVAPLVVVTVTLTPNPTDGPPYVPPSSASSTPETVTSSSASPSPSPSPSARATSTGVSTPTPTPVATPTASASAPPSAVASVVVTGTDAGPGGVCYPSLRGTAAPGATLLLTSYGTLDQTVVADATGAWSSPRLTGLAAGTTSVVVSDASGQAGSAAQVVTVPVPPAFGVSQGAAGLTVRAVGGIPGMTAEVQLDGVSLGLVSFDATGSATAVFAVSPAPGTHTATLGYVTSVCTGPVASLAVTTT